MIRTTLAAFLALLAAGASAAELQTLDPQRPVLKAEATVTGSFVHIGDLVDHAGIVAKVPIFRAPDLGFTGTVSANDVAEAVRKHALIGIDTGGITEVTVTRAARTIPVKDIESLVTRALSVQFNIGKLNEISVVFDREMKAIHVEPSALGEPKIAHITYNGRSGRFDATLDIPTGANSHGFLRIGGRAQATVEVVTIARPLDRGTVLKDSDVLLEKRPRAEIGPDVITDRDQAVGLAARTQLQPGRPLRAVELMKPELVRRNETVTLIYEVPGISLTVRGKAAESGAEGDTITVLNEQSKRSVQGVIVGPGRVLISTNPARLAANIAREPAQLSNAR